MKRCWLSDSPTRRRQNVRSIKRLCHCCCCFCWASTGEIYKSHTTCKTRRDAKDVVAVSCCNCSGDDFPILSWLVRLCTSRRCGISHQKLNRECKKYAICSIWARFRIASIRNMRTDSENKFFFYIYKL